MNMDKSFLLQHFMPSIVNERNNLSFTINDTIAEKNGSDNVFIPEEYPHTIEQKSQRKKRTTRCYHTPDGSVIKISVMTRAYSMPPIIMKIGANTRDTIVISLIRILMDGPDVSLNGSPTVSPTTAAL